MDADKERYEEYFETVLPLLADGGVIVVDNAGRVLMSDGSYVDCETVQNLNPTSYVTIVFLQSIMILRTVYCSFIRSS